jgi:hypothetical protein
VALKLGVLAAREKTNRGDRHFPSTVNISKRVSAGDIRPADSWVIPGVPSGLLTLCILQTERGTAQAEKPMLSGRLAYVVRPSEYYSRVHRTN